MDMIHCKFCSIDFETNEDAGKCPRCGESWWIEISYDDDHMSLVYDLHWEEW